MAEAFSQAILNDAFRYLNYPTIQYIGNFADHDKVLMSKRNLMAKSYPCDLHLLNFRTLPLLSNPTTPSSDALLILHTQTPDCTLAGPKPIPGCPAVSVSGKSVFDAKNFLDFGSEVRAKHFVRTSLTGNTNEAEEAVDKMFDVDPMTLEAVRVQF